MVLQLVKRFRSFRGAFEWTPCHNEATALLHVLEAVLKLENLLTSTALNPDLIYDVIEVAILLLIDKGALTLGAASTTLGEPLVNAASMENLLARCALHGAC